MHFNLCAHKDCRKKAFAIAKDGDGFCAHHTLFICNEYGMNEFWPHYHVIIIDEMRRLEDIERSKAEKKQRQEARQSGAPSFDALILEEISKRKITKIKDK